MICPRCNLAECTPRCGWCDYLPTAAERETVPAPEAEPTSTVPFVTTDDLPHAQSTYVSDDVIVKVSFYADGRAWDASWSDDRQRHAAEPSEAAEAVLRPLVKQASDALVAARAGDVEAPTPMAARIDAAREEGRREERERILEWVDARLEAMRHTQTSARVDGIRRGLADVYNEFGCDRCGGPHATESCDALGELWEREDLGWHDPSTLPMGFINWAVDNPAEGLRMLMSDISEEYYCAGWLIGLGDILWSMVQGGDRRLGLGTVTEDQVLAMAWLAELGGVWWDNEERPVPLEEWK